MSHKFLVLVPQSEQLNKKIPLTMLLTASTVNARDMNKAKISSVDLNKSEKINVYGKNQNIKYRKEIII